MPIEYRDGFDLKRALYSNAVHIFTANISRRELYTAAHVANLLKAAYTARTVVRGV